MEKKNWDTQFGTELVYRNEQIIWGHTVNVGGGGGLEPDPASVAVDFTLYDEGVGHGSGCANERRQENAQS